MVLLIYLSNMWDNDYNYQWTLIDANHYYETSPFEAKKFNKFQSGKIIIHQVMDI
jgi:hypothetical protein